MTRPFRTHDIDLAAARMCLTGEQPNIVTLPGDHLSSFELPCDEITSKLLNSYATGDLCLNVKRFSSCRNFLYKKLRGGSR